MLILSAASLAAMFYVFSVIWILSRIAFYAGCGQWGKREKWWFAFIERFYIVVLATFLIAWGVL